MIAGNALHGGPDAEGVPAHDFSTNANACGPCPSALQAVQGADAARYPDPAYTTVRAQLAAFHGVAPERIVPAGSASEFIVRMTAAVADAAGCVQLPTHAYGDYARAAGAYGLPTGTGDGPAALAWACDPSSPLGQADEGLAGRIDRLAEGVPLVLDCAYEPLRLHGHAPLDRSRRDRIWQLWSPNKAMGLTGVRGAYAIAPAAHAGRLLVRLQALAPSWPLGAHAAALLQAWVQPAAQTWLAGCLPTLRGWKRAQIDLCAALGWHALPSETNYFCARVDRPDLAADLRRLRAAGVKLRDAAPFGLPGHVRLAVLAPASQQALWRAWHG